MHKKGEKHEIFSNFPQKVVLHISWKYYIRTWWFMQFAWNVKYYILEKNENQKKNCQFADFAVSRRSYNLVNCHFSVCLY